MGKARPSVPDDGSGASSRQYRRGAIMGMTMAEAFVLIAFILLLLLASWKTQRDAETERFTQVAMLTQKELQAAAELSKSGRLEDAAGLLRLVEHTSASPELLRLSQAELSAVAALSEKEQLEAVADLVNAGLDFKLTEDLKDPAEMWRLIDSDELRRMVDAAEELPTDLQRDLADLVEINDSSGLIEILERTKRAPEDTELKQRIAVIGERFDRAKSQERRMVEDLQKTLGPKVTEIGGHIENDGSIVLPDTILFNVGESRITPLMEQFLEVACQPWLEVLMRSPAPVSGAKIEGHASSEWRTDTSADNAYLNNLALSQDRSAAVLDACLKIVIEPEIKDWAHEHLVAVGYSSARRIIENGNEDKEKSRRVVFSVDIDDDELLAEVESEINSGLSSTNQPAWLAKEN